MKRSAVMIVMVVAMAGCSSEPKLVPVKVTVKLDGKPSEQVTVCFFWSDTSVTDPSRAGFGRGITGQDGKVAIKDMFGRDGIYPGKYKVTFEKFVTASGKPLPSDAKPEAIYGGARNMLPKKYHNAETTDITVEVPAAGLDTVLEIRSK